MLRRHRLWPRHGPYSVANGYDALGRLSEHDSDRGAFTLSYLGETGQPVLRKLGGTGATLQTAWCYLPNSGDRRLAAIANTGLTVGQYSNFAFDTTPENQITGITETSDAPAVYPPARLKRNGRPSRPLCFTLSRSGSSPDPARRSLPPRIR